MRVLVCGGRNFNDREAVWRALDALHKQTPISVLIEGGASGADRLAFQWASEGNRCGTETHAADWASHGRAAGPIRNQKMLDVGQPDMVVAFPGGRGTEDMVTRARAIGVNVWRVPSPSVTPEEP